MCNSVHIINGPKGVAIEIIVYLKLGVRECTICVFFK